MNIEEPVELHVDTIIEFDEFVYMIEKSLSLEYLVKLIKTLDKSMEDWAKTEELYEYFSAEHQKYKVICGGPVMSQYEATHEEKRFFAAVKKLFEEYPEFKYIISPVDGTITVINEKDVTPEMGLQLGTAVAALASYYGVE